MALNNLNMLLSLFVLLSVWFIIILIVIFVIFFFVLNVIDSVCGGYFIRVFVVSNRFASFFVCVFVVRFVN